MACRRFLFEKHLERSIALAIHLLREQVLPACWKWWQHNKRDRTYMCRVKTSRPSSRERTGIAQKDNIDGTLYKSIEKRFWVENQSTARRAPYSATSPPSISTDKSKQYDIQHKIKKPARFLEQALFVTRQRPTVPLPHGSSIIGLGGLNFRVRYGNGCDPSGKATGNF